MKQKKPLEECPHIQEAMNRAVSELGDDGRVLVRYSGTEPLLRVMMEGPSKPKLLELTKGIVDQARKALGSA